MSFIVCKIKIKYTKNIQLKNIRKLKIFSTEVKKDKKNLKAPTANSFKAHYRTAIQIVKAA